MYTVASTWLRLRDRQAAGSGSSFVLPGDVHDPDRSAGSPVAGGYDCFAAPVARTGGNSGTCGCADRRLLATRRRHPKQKQKEAHTEAHKRRADPGGRAGCGSLLQA